MQIHAVKVVDKTACLNVHKVALGLVQEDVVEVAVVTVKEIAQELAKEGAVMVVPEVVLVEICLFHIKRGRWS